MSNELRDKLRDEIAAKIASACGREIVNGRSPAPIIAAALDRYMVALQAGLETAIKCGDGQREAIATMREALDQVVTVLGPYPAGCDECEGCQVEMNEALKAATHALEKIDGPAKKDGLLIRGALETAILYLEHEMPLPPDHNCGDPDSNCDMGCVDYSQYCSDLHRIKQALAELTGEKNA